jgi:hypothetical protein
MVKPHRLRRESLSVLFVVQINDNYKQRILTMTTVQPEGEDLRKAVKWISDERQYGDPKPLIKLIEEASLKFDLSPIDAEYLVNFFRKEEC